MELGNVSNYDVKEDNIDSAYAIHVFSSYSAAL